jgi:bacillopeptidase F
MRGVPPILRKRISRLHFSLSLLVSFILFLSLALPNIAVAQGGSIESKPRSTIKNTSIENKVDSKHIKQFKV